MIIAETCQSKDLLELRGICEFGDWLDLLWWGGVKNLPEGAALGANSLSS